MMLALVQCAVAAEVSPPTVDVPGIFSIKNCEIEQLRLPKRSRLVSETTWINVAHFPEINTRIPLSRTSASRPTKLVDGREYVARYGFDPSTFKLRWRTFPRGSGIYMHDGNIVLQVYRGSVCEIFRDSFCSVGRDGWKNGESSRLDIGYEPDSNELVLRKQIRAVTGRETPIPMGRKGHTDDGVTVYFRTVTTLKTWRYRVIPFGLRYESSHEELLLGDSVYGIAAVAAMAGVAIENLRRDNPDLRESDTCTGTVVLRPYINAYRASRYDALAQIK